MINKRRILVFPCGSEIGLEINRALANDIHFEMFGASSLPDHGKFVYKNYIEDVPFVDKANFIDEINKICEKYKIDYIFPAHDSVVLKLAQYQNELKAQVITSCVETCEIARSKKKTYEVLKDTILVPKTYSINDKNIKYPVFIKPNVGQGSKGARRCNTKQELAVAYNNNKEIVICELLPGKEYTIDCFTNSNGELLFAKGRVRTRISNGISVNSRAINNPKFKEIALKINEKVKFSGMWFFQVKENLNGELVLLEIAPRIAGTMNLYRVLGVNFALLALYDKMGFDVKIITNNFDIEIDRALYTAYKTNIDYDCVYIDFDDTLIFDNKTNTNAIKFLYQAKNENKKIILITKHEKDVVQSLKEHYICKDLFDEIIHIAKADKKINYIKCKPAIFIDDSYSERKEVLEKLNIPVFDLDSIEALINYKN